jgi:hypothetical protein
MDGQIWSRDEAGALNGLSSMADADYVGVPRIPAAHLWWPSRSDLIRADVSYYELNKESRAERRGSRASRGEEGSESRVRSSWSVAQTRCKLFRVDPS